MRFIVDLYRHVILGGIALAIILLVYGTLKVATSSDAYGVLVFVYGGLALIAVIMALGMTATFISIHDRHAELVDELRAIRAELADR